MSAIICYCWWYCWWFRNPVKTGWFDLVDIYIYVNIQFVRYHYSVQGFIHVRCFAEVLLLQGLDLGRGVNCQPSMECFIGESTSGSWWVVILRSNQVKTHVQKIYVLFEHPNWLIKNDVGGISVIFKRSGCVEDSFCTNQRWLPSAMRIEKIFREMDF